MQKSNQNYHDDFLKSKIFDDYLKFMRESFWWKAGTYTISFTVRSPVRVKLASNKFEFHLTQDNIDLIKKNLDEIKNDIEYTIKKPDLTAFSGQMGAWNWLNPILKKSNT